MRIGSLFSGYGGLDMGVQSVLGGEVAWHAEIDKHAARILDYHWPDVPNLGDVSAVDWSTVEPVDVLTGGFPCQDVSTAGLRKGLAPGTRSGLWSEFARAIDELRPALVVIENVRGLLSAYAASDMEPCPWCLGDSGGEPPLRALGAVLGDLADLGYDAAWAGVRAADAGAPHGRFRVFIVAADAERKRHDRSGERGGEAGQVSGRPDAARSAGDSADADGTGPQGTQPARRRDVPAGGDRHTPADASGDGWDEGRPEPARLVGRPDAAERGAVAADASGERHGRGQDARRLGRMDDEDAGGAREWQRAREVAGDRGAAAAADAEGTGAEVDNSRLWTEPDGGHNRASTEWGNYAAAIHRWERVLGRVAPPPTEPGANGPRLSPAFVEWMMGLDAGHVTNVDISRNHQLKALGNGVVPQQAAHALRLILGGAA